MSPVRHRRMLRRGHSPPLCQGKVACRMAVPQLPDPRRPYLTLGLRSCIGLTGVCRRLPIVLLWPRQSAV